MRLARVHVDEDLRAGQSVTLDGGAANHVVRVLRLRVGDALTLFNGRGGEYVVKLEEIRRATAVVSVLEHRALERESPFHLTLAQGISRGERMDWVIQKATELGAARIVPLFTERSMVHLDEQQAAKKLQHWHSIAIAACEQCGRNRIPEIAAPLDLPHFLQQRSAQGAALLLSPRAPQRIQDIESARSSATVLIGPEGGLADLEQEVATGAGFTPVRLGPRVLRTETAAICALTLLQQRFGDL
jgi:16S rRNA (uracil1498-N3)-methyltransferase